MSDCEHNDHGHGWIWLFILGLCFNSSCTDCSGDRRELRRQLDQAQQDIKDARRQADDAKAAADRAASDLAYTQGAVQRCGCR